MEARLDPQTDQEPVRARTLRPETGTPLYLHLPYCVEKCTYCDFFSVAAEGEDLQGTLEAVLLEAEARAPMQPRTVFVGGGTPSLYDPDSLRRLFEGLERITGFRSSAREVTVECNPESLTVDKARLLRSLGVDRLSIGVQSLRAQILALFGRVHDAEDALRAYAAARAGGFERVSLDLIYAVPGQSLEEWHTDLERLLALGPDHVSAYHLAYEPGTLLAKWESQGRLERLDESLELAFFETTRTRLSKDGWSPYELSNFATEGQQCHHNINYWQNGPYVGIGPSAVSALEGTRFGNPRSIQAWTRAVRAGDLAATWEETLTPRARLGETWWLGLRASAGVDPRVARRTAGLPDPSAAERDPPADPCEVLAERLCVEGWLERVEPAPLRYRLSPAGLPLGDAVTRRFLEATAES